MKQDTLELLCVKVGENIVAMDIMGIREITRINQVVPLPKAPPHIAGVVNLRGELIPVIDLRKALFDLPRTRSEQEARLVVVRAGNKTAALLMDQVIEVVSVPVQDLNPAPSSQGGSGAVVAVFQREKLADHSQVAVLVKLGALLQEL